MPTSCSGPSSACTARRSLKEPVWDCQRFDASSKSTAERFGRRVAWTTVQPSPSLSQQRTETPPSQKPPPLDSDFQRRAPLHKNERPGGPFSQSFALVWEGV